MKQIRYLVSKFFGIDKNRTSLKKMPIQCFMKATKYILLNMFSLFSSIFLNKQM